MKKKNNIGDIDFCSSKGMQIIMSAALQVLNVFFFNVGNNISLTMLTKIFANLCNIKDAISCTLTLN